jgi:hypothetical protein
MPPSFDSDVFEQQTATAFPRFELTSDVMDFGRIHLRFELGDGHANGTSRRVEQATERALVLFERCMLPADSIVLIVNEFGISGDELNPTDPDGYLGTLIPELAACSNTVIVNGEDGEPLLRRSFIRTAKSRFDYRGILRGIANLEQGRTPCINESIYFVNESKSTVFYMYDDRGCLIYSSVAETLASLYVDHNDWLVDYHREHFDAIWGARVGR